MPKYTPSDEEMDDSYSAAPPVKPPAEKPAEQPASIDEENAAQADLLVEKAKLPPNVKAGDTCTFRVTKDFGDEVALQFVSPGEEAPTEEAAEETPSTEQDMAALDKEGSM